MARQWKPDEISGMMRGYQAACVLSAAADLGVFAAIDRKEFTAEELATQLQANVRGMRTLLDALAGLELLEKSADRYRMAPGVADGLTANGPKTQLAMIHHQGNCLRRWAQLAQVARTGKPAAPVPSVRGEDADKAAFIEAMNNISAPIADTVVSEIGPPEFTHLLDVGGASGTWTAAFLRTRPEAKATIFDLPHVIPMAQARLEHLRLTDRVRLVPGDFTRDELPTGADLAWVSAIVHQQDRAANRQLFAAIHKALVPGGRILIRDIIMSEDHTKPAGGALFAINMLVATETGGTFTLGELSEDLAAVGYTNPRQIRQDPWMDAVVEAEKPR